MHQYLRKLNKYVLWTEKTICHWDDMQVTTPIHSGAMCSRAWRAQWPGL